MYSIAKDWITLAGYRAIVILYREPMPHYSEAMFRDMWYCGYVGVPTEHPLYGVSYGDSSPALEGYVNADTEMGKRGIFPMLLANGNFNTPDTVFNVHGSVTFADKLPHTDSDLWWFGFDSHHGGDNLREHNAEYMASECESLSEQLKEVYESFVQAGRKTGSDGV